MRNAHHIWACHRPSRLPSRPVRTRREGGRVGSHPSSWASVRQPASERGRASTSEALVPIPPPLRQPASQHPEGRYALMDQVMLATCRPLMTASASHACLASERPRPSPSFPLLSHAAHAFLATLSFCFHSHSHSFIFHRPSDASIRACKGDCPRDELAEQTQDGNVQEHGKESTGGRRRKGAELPTISGRQREWHCRTHAKPARIAARRVAAGRRVETHQSRRKKNTLNAASLCTRACHHLSKHSNALLPILPILPLLPLQRRIVCICDRPAIA